jgi:hypothetical protein
LGSLDAGTSVPGLRINIPLTLLALTNAVID